MTIGMRCPREFSMHWQWFASLGKSIMGKARSGGDEKIRQASTVKIIFHWPYSNEFSWLLTRNSLSQCLHTALLPVSFAELIFSCGRVESQGFNLDTNDLRALWAPVNTLQGKILWFLPHFHDFPSWLRGVWARERRSHRTSTKFHRILVSFHFLFSFLNLKDLCCIQPHSYTN